MKRFFSVKEASNLLGVSTNTVYKYLDEGKLEFRRIGKGRIKILSSSLKPYIQEVPERKTTETLVVQKPSVTTEVVQKEEDVKGLEEMPIAKYDEEPKENIFERKGDFVFFRLYKGLLLIGLGLLHIFENLVYSSSQARTSSLTSLYVLPFVLSVIGVMVLIQLFYSKRLKDFGVVSHAVSLIALLTYSIAVFVAGRYTLVVFPASLALVEIGHLVRKKLEASTFFSEFTKYLVLVLALGGVFVLANPGIFPINSFVIFVESYRAIVAIVWFLVFVPPSLFLLSPNGKDSKFIAPAFFVVYALMSFIFATELSYMSLWAASFINYMTGIFALFLAWWKVSQMQIELERLKYVMVSFIWIMASLALGLWVILMSQEQARSQSLRKAQRELGAISAQTSSVLEDYQAKLVQAAGSSKTFEALEVKDAEQVTVYAKEIFENLGYAKGVVIYDSLGVALGTYPRNYLTVGNDYSSTNYFSKTKESYKNYISSVMKDSQGQDVLIQTEPVFLDNGFHGMIALFIDLDNLAVDFTSNIDKNLNLHILDENGTYIVGAKPELFGKKVEESDLFLVETETSRMDAVARSSVNYPRWQMFMEVPAYSSLMGTSTMNIALSIFIMVNSIFSLSAGVIIATKRGVEELRSSLGRTPLINPQIS